MSNTDVSQEVWKRKDYLSARQTAANVTSYVFEGKEISSENFLKFADDIFSWLFQEQEKLHFDEITTTKVEPTLTVAQQKVKDAVEKEFGKEVTIDCLFNWAKSVGHEGKLPENLKSVNKIVEFVKGK